MLVDAANQTAWTIAVKAAKLQGNVPPNANKQPAAPSLGRLLLNAFQRREFYESYIHFRDHMSLLRL